jgi:hypothetical protein
MIFHDISWYAMKSKGQYWCNEKKKHRNRRVPPLLVGATHSGPSSTMSGWTRCFPVPQWRTRRCSEIMGFPELWMLEGKIQSYSGKIVVNIDILGILFGWIPEKKATAFWDAGCYRYTHFFWNNHVHYLSAVGLVWWDH